MKFGELIGFERKTMTEYNLGDSAARAFVVESARSGLNVDLFVKHYREACDSMPNAHRTFILSDIPSHHEDLLIRAAIIGAYQEVKGGDD